MISVIIVNYCTRELLRDCLASLRASRDPAVEIIVVDNHSTDASVEMVRAEFSEFRLITNSENLGFAQGNNTGIWQARGKYILLLNSDTLVRPGALQAMTRFLDSHPTAGGVTCRLLNGDGTIQACVSRRPGPMLLFFRLSGLSHLFGSDRARRFVRRYLGWLLGATVRSYLDPYAASESPLEVENISGACLMLRREAVEQVGLLDESFFMYFEDMDYCIRLRKAGWKLFYVPTGEIVHLVGQSSGGRMRDYSVSSYQSLFYFYRKHHSFWKVLAVRILVFFASSIRWAWSLAHELSADSSAYRRNRLDLQQVIRLCFD